MEKLFQRIHLCDWKSIKGGSCWYRLHGLVYSGLIISIGKYKLFYLMFLCMHIHCETAYGNGIPVPLFVDMFFCFIVIPPRKVNDTNNYYLPTDRRDSFVIKHVSSTRSSHLQSRKYRVWSIIIVLNQLDLTVTGKAYITANRTEK